MGRSIQRGAIVARPVVLSSLRADLRHRNPYSLPDSANSQAQVCGPRSECPTVPTDRRTGSHRGRCARPLRRGEYDPNPLGALQSLGLCIARLREAAVQSRIRLCARHSGITSPSAS